jgi:outer membrane autotransporter protein
MKKTLTKLANISLTSFLLTTSAYAFTEDEYRRVGITIMDIQNANRHNGRFLQNEMDRNRNGVIVDIANLQGINQNDVREILADMFPLVDQNPAELAAIMPRVIQPVHIPVGGNVYTREQINSYEHRLRSGERVSNEELAAYILRDHNVGVGEAFNLLSVETQNDIIIYQDALEQELIQRERYARSDQERENRRREYLARQNEYTSSIGERQLQRNNQNINTSDPYIIDLANYSVAKVNDNEEKVNGYLIKTLDDNYVGNCTDMATKLDMFNAHLMTIDDKSLETLEASQVQIENEVTNNVITNINNRLDNVGFIPLGISSGDNDKSLLNGAWVSGLYSQIEQKNDNKTNLGYKGKIFGPIIGFDTNLNENTLLGIAYSYIQSDIKYSKNRQKTSADSHALSLYTQSQINDFLWNNIFSASMGNVNKKVNRQVLPSVFKIGIGKTKSESYSLDSSLGYKIHIADTNFTIVPQISGRYAVYKESGYKEKGFGIQNKTYGGKSTQSLLGTLGVKFISRNKISEDTELMPSFDLSVENEFTDKKPKINSKYSVFTEKIIPISGDRKKDTLKYNVGLSTLLVHKNIEMLAAYNCSFQKKYQNHQGYLKFKLLF